FLSFLTIGSRQSLVVALFFVFVFIILLNLRYGIRFLFKILPYFIVGFIGLLFLFIGFQNTILVQRLVNTDLEGDSRYFIILNALNLFWQRPFIGYGPGTYGNYDIFVYTHSTPAELLFTGGVF